MNAQQPLLPTIQETTVAVDRCSHCHAIIPPKRVKTRLDQIAGNHHAKRIMELAIVGGHSVFFLERGGVGAMFASVATQHGLTVYVEDHCMCGCYQDPDRMCVCTPEMIAQWHARESYQTALNADMVCEVVNPRYSDIMNMNAGHIVRDEIALEFVPDYTRLLANAPQDLKPDRAGHLLLDNAYKQLNLTQEDVERILHVSRTIWATFGGHSPHISPAYIAEALQYRRRR